MKELRNGKKRKWSEMNVQWGRGRRKVNPMRRKRETVVKPWPREILSPISILKEKGIYKLYIETYINKYVSVDIYRFKYTLITWRERKWSVGQFYGMSTLVVLFNAKINLFFFLSNYSYLMIYK